MSGISKKLNILKRTKIIKGLILVVTIIVAFIFYNAVVILRPALAEIMDAAPSNEIVDKVKKLAAAVPQVKGIEKCYVRKMGFDYFVDIHIEVDGAQSVTEGHRISHLVKDAILDSNLRVINVLVHVEPFNP